MLPKVQTSAEITNDTAKDYILSQNYIREKPEEITSLTSKDSSKVDISDVTGENDFASYFVLSHSNNFVEVNKMSSEKIIPVIDLSKLSLIGLETINYEIICMIGKRVPRVYIKDGKIIKVRNYM